MNILLRLRLHHALAVSSVSLVGYALAGLPPIDFGYALVLSSVLLFNVYTYAYNDLLDAPYDAKDPYKNKRNVFCGKKNRNAGLFFILTLFATTLIFSLSINSFYFALILVMLVLMTLYSGPIFRAKTKPFWDVLFHATWTALIVIAGAYYYTGFTLSLVFVSFLLFAQSAVSELLQEIDDFVVDKKTKQRTTVQALGLNNSIRLTEFLIALNFLMLGFSFLFISQFILFLFVLSPLILSFLGILRMREGFGNNYRRFVMFSGILCFALLI